MDLSAYSMQGRRSHMEDFFDIGYHLASAEKQQSQQWPFEYFYFAIFDGHGGREAAQYAKKNLLKMIVRQTDFWSQDDEDVMRAIRQGFADCHTSMRKHISSWQRANKTLPSTAGTTASILFIKNGKFYSGHVGDSRIVISRKHPETNRWISHQLTEDHKPESRSETDRIRRAGGEVKSKFGVHRVVWRRPIWTKEFDAKLKQDPDSNDYTNSLKQIQSYPIEESLVDGYQVIPFLAIARSLGDFWSINPHSGQYIVSPEPDVMCRPIDENDKCILLATDGLWNVMNSSLAVKILQELKIIKDGERNSPKYAGDYFATDNYYDVSIPSKGAKNHALSLVYIAYQMWERRRLRSDNITAVVAMLCDILTPTTKSRPITRRSSKEIIAEQANLFTPEYIEAQTVQLGQTHIFCESILSRSPPIFYANPGSEAETKMWNEIETHLIFPPTVFGPAPPASITAPRNYNRLSNAKCKRLIYEDEYCSEEEELYIYIKTISDDPADEEKGPVRMNARNKLVRDSSCQASQAIHDFGQPWPEMKVVDELFDEREFEIIPSTELVLGDLVDEAYLAKIRNRNSNKRPRLVPSQM